jgi:hypothetical protein
VLLYQNCGWWNNFDCIFEFSLKSYVRNTINLPCAKILFPSVISHLLTFDASFTNSGVEFTKLTHSISVEVKPMIKFKHSEPQSTMKHSFSYSLTNNYISLCRGNNLLVQKPDRNQIDELVMNKEKKLMWLLMVSGCLMIPECDAVLFGEYFVTWRNIVLSCQEPLTQQYRAMSQKIGILNNTTVRISNVTAHYYFSGEGWILFLLW